MRGGFGDQPRRADIAGLRQCDEPVDVDRPAAPPRRAFERLDETRGKLQTPAIAAAAKLAVGIDRHVAEFARPAGAPRSTRPPTTIAPPTPRSTLNKTKSSHPTAAPQVISAIAAQLLSLSAKIGRSNAGSNTSRMSTPAQTRHDARPLNPPVRPDGPRNRDADAEQRAQRQALRRVDFAQGGARGFRRLGGSIVATEREPCFTYDGMRNVGCQQPELVQPQVQADACASLGIERIGRRGAADAAHGFRRRKLDDEAGPP